MIAQKTGGVNGGKRCPRPRGFGRAPRGDTFRSVRCQHSATMFRRQSRPVHRAIRGALPRFSGVLGDRNPPSRLFLLYRQRHVLFLTGQKENVGLKQWVLEITTLWLAEATTKPAAWYFPPRYSLISTTSSVTALPCHLPLKGKAWRPLPYSARYFSIS